MSIEFRLSDVTTFFRWSRTLVYEGPEHVIPWLFISAIGAHLGSMGAVVQLRDL
jgi:hypothetical protein